MWKKQITYTLCMLLSKVTRSWNIPGNRKQQQQNENHKDTSLLSASMAPAWPALRQSWKALLDLHQLPRFHYMLSLHRCPLQGNPSWNEIFLDLSAMGAAATELFECSAGLDPAPAIFTGSSCARTTPEPLFSVVATAQVLPSPTGNTSVLWATLTTPVTWLWPERVHRATCQFKKLTNGLGKQEKSVGFNVFLLFLNVKTLCRCK